MDIRTSVFDFLRTKHLTQVGDFSPSVDSGDPVDHCNVLKSHFCVINFIVEFNELFKSGLGIEIGQLCVEIQLLSHRKTGKIATFRKNRKFSKYYIFTFFHLKFHF
jgi:hypothetical protein